MEKKYLVGLFMVLLMASCTTSQDSPSIEQPIQNAPEVETKEPTSAEVSIVTGGRQDPSEISIAVGGVVTWKNLDSKSWKIYSSKGSKEINSIEVKAGETYDHKFDTPGVYDVLTLGINIGTKITVVE